MENLFNFKIFYNSLILIHCEVITHFTYIRTGDLSYQLYSQGFGIIGFFFFTNSLSFEFIYSSKYCVSTV